MTDEQINRRIAEACGWKPTTDGGICWDNQGNAIVTPPSYCRDLNAMHEAEATLTSVEIRDYVHHLGRIDLAQKDWPAIHATARQRAEAFLRTIGKWEEAQ